jgi:hypothetical protein
MMAGWSDLDGRRAGDDEHKHQCHEVLPARVKAADQIPALAPLGKGADAAPTVSRRKIRGAAAINAVLA